jgi:hypothetical protein
MANWRIPWDSGREYSRERTRADIILNVVEGLVLQGDPAVTGYLTEVSDCLKLRSVAKETAVSMPCWTPVSEPSETDWKYICLPSTLAMLNYINEFSRKAYLDLPGWGYFSAEYDAMRSFFETSTR